MLNNEVECIGHLTSFWFCEMYKVGDSCQLMLISLNTRLGIWCFYKKNLVLHTVELMTEVCYVDSPSYIQLD